MAHPRTLIDASALLELLNRGPGAETVAAAIPGAAISAVGYSDVMMRLKAQGLSKGDVKTALNLGLEVVPFGGAEVDALGSLKHEVGNFPYGLEDLATIMTFIATAKSGGYGRIVTAHPGLKSALTKALPGVEIIELPSSRPRRKPRGKR